MLIIYAVTCVFASNGCGGGDSGANGDGSTALVEVTPIEAVVTPVAQKQFNVEVTGLSDTSVTWEVVEGSSGGSITQSGMYTAPAAVGLYHIRAVSNADAAISGTAAVIVTVSFNFSAVDGYTGTVNMTINDSVSYNFSHGPGLDYRDDTYFTENVTYSAFLLHGAIEQSSGVYYWNSFNGETMTVSGSLDHREDWYGHNETMLVQRDSRIAQSQSKTVQCYFRVTVDTVKMKYTIEFDNVYFDAVKNWEDFESGDYEKGTAITEPTQSCKAEGLPLFVSASGRLTGTKTGIPIHVITNPDLYVDATLTWDISPSP
jgi:hypothetical protein